MNVIERLREAAEDWRTGRGYGYPRCCIAHYCWDVLLSRAPSAVRFQQVAYDMSTPSSRWDSNPRSWDRMPQVPCGVFHTRGATYALMSRIGRIIAFNIPEVRTKIRVPVAAQEDPPPPCAWMDNREYARWLRGATLDADLDWDCSPAGVADAS